MNVALCDVGPQDGLQHEPETLTPAQRAELCVQLAACGLPGVEAASFVREDRVSQMAGAEAVIAALPAVDGTRWSALVLNYRGVERALVAGLTEIHIAVMATQASAQRSTNQSLADALAGARRMVGFARAAGARVVGTVSVAFGCPFEGRVSPDAALAVAQALAGAGATALVLADTIGVATPSSVKRLVRRALELGLPVGAHLHDTRNTAIANALAALEAGATTFETSVGGIGRGPFASEGASGNLATEDLVYVLEKEGVSTGIDLDAVIGVSRGLEQTLGRPVPAALVRAGGWPG
jgi:isopropylmalate/homocitrate/citramalate synthase